MDFNHISRQTEFISWLHIIQQKQTMDELSQYKVTLSNTGWTESRIYLDSGYCFNSTTGKIFSEAFHNWYLFMFTTWYIQYVQKCGQILLNNWYIWSCVRILGHVQKYAPPPPPSPSLPPPILPLPKPPHRCQCLQAPPCKLDRFRSWMSKRILTARSESRMILMSLESADDED